MLTAAVTASNRTDVLTPSLIFTAIYLRIVAPRILLCPCRSVLKVASFISDPTAGRA